MRRIFQAGLGVFVSIHVKPLLLSVDDFSVAVKWLLGDASVHYE
jgi:hypothetical protein